PSSLAGSKQSPAELHLRRSNPTQIDLQSSRKRESTPRKSQKALCVGWQSSRRDIGTQKNANTRAPQYKFLCSHDAAALRATRGPRSRRTHLRHEEPILALDTPPHKILQATK